MAETNNPKTAGIKNIRLEPASVKDDIKPIAESAIPTVMNIPKT